MSADKSRNIYEINKEDYEKLMHENIGKISKVIIDKINTKLLEVYKVN